MLVNRTEYATGLGDLASELKSRSARNKPTNAPSLVSTYGTNLSQKVRVGQSLNRLISLNQQASALDKYNQDLAAGNINPNFVKAPAAVDPAMLAAAQQAYQRTVRTSGTLAQKAALGPMVTVSQPTDTGALLSPGALANLFKPIVKAAPGTPSAAPTPVQQAAAAVVAAIPAIQAQQSALTSTGGGGGGGGDTSSLTPDASTTDMTTDEPTGWAGMSTTAKVAVVGGAVVALGVVIYMVRRHH